MTRSQSTEGLDEARRAVRALRDDAEPLSTQLDKLCAASVATLAVVGRQRHLAPEATLALYRVAQESLTNAAKHAPGAHLRQDRQPGSHPGGGLRHRNGLAAPPAGRPGS